MKNVDASRRIFFAVLPVLILTSVFLFSCAGEGSVPESEAPPTLVTAEPVEKNEKSIAIPGYESLTLQAGTAEQPIELSNPIQNTCYFQVSLLLSDGTLLWKSSLFEPGKTSGAIRLSTPLSPGTYPEAVLHYDCFRMDESQTPINGAEMKLTLIVR